MIKMRLTVILLIITTLFGLLASLPGTALADDPVKVVVNGKNVVFPDAQPYIDNNGRIIVPLRFVSEALNCDVKWNGETQTVTIDRSRIHVELTIGKKEITVLRIEKTMDTTAVLKNERTLVPARFVSEAFGCKVNWDQKTRTATITDPGKDIYKVGEFELAIEEGDELTRSINGGLNIYKKSGLIITEEIGDDRVSSLVFQIKVDLPETDIPKQRKETEAFLKQCISVKFVDEMMEHAAKKTDRFDELEKKRWDEGKYMVLVSGGVSPIFVRVFIYSR
jgi:hypothetical protein